MATPSGTPKPKLTEEKQAQICAILTVGGTRQMAADYVGCHVKTIQNTAKREPEFAARLRRSELAPEITLLKAIQTAVEDPKQWRTATWALERLYPARYRQRKPETLTPQQIAAVLEEFLTAITEVVPPKQYRRRIWDRIDSLSTEASGTTIEEQPKIRHAPKAES